MQLHKIAKSYLFIFMSVETDAVICSMTISALTFNFILKLFIER